MEDHRSDLASALALNPVEGGAGEAPSAGVSPRPFLLLQRKPWLGTDLEYEGPQIPESWVHL